MSLIKSDEYTETWSKRTWPGVIPTTIIVCLIVTLALAANFIKYYKYKSAWFSKKKSPIILGENQDTDGNQLPQISQMLNIDGNTADLINGASGNMSQQVLA